jgi:hypothetical protein
MNNLETSLKLKLSEIDYTFSETSYLGLEAGDLIQVTYGGSVRYGLVVRSTRRPRPMFLSTQNNTLISMMLVDNLSEAMFSLMVNNLYNNRVASNYRSLQGPTILSAFLGKESFRTLNVTKMKDILKINIVE